MAKMGRPKTDNPKNVRAKLMLTEEEALRLKEYASAHDMTIAGVLRRGLLLQYEMDDPTRGNS